MHRRLTLTMLSIVPAGHFIFGFEPVSDSLELSELLSESLSLLLDTSTGADVLDFLFLTDPALVESRLRANVVGRTSWPRAHKSIAGLT